MSTAQPTPPLVTKEQGAWGSYEFKSEVSQSGTAAEYEYTILNQGNQGGHFKWKSALIERRVEAGKAWNQTVSVNTGGMFGVMGQPVQYDHWNAITRDPSVAVQQDSGGVLNIDRCPAYLPWADRWSILARSAPARAVVAGGPLVVGIIKIVLAGMSPGLELLSEVEDGEGEDAYRFKYRIANQSSRPYYVRWGAVQRRDVPGGWPDHPREIAPGAVVAWGEDFVARGPLGILGDVVFWGDAEGGSAEFPGMKFPGRNPRELGDLREETAQRQTFLPKRVSAAYAPFFAPQALMG